jgi:hypothetical protein
MRTPPAVFRDSQRSFGLLVIFLLMAVTGSAIDLSGIYADGGTTIPSGTDRSVEEPSLRALLSLEFDSNLVSALRDQTSHVVIKHEGDQLLIEVYDVNETVSWSARWIEGREYVIQNARLIARFPPTRVGGEEILLVIERLPDHGLLQVSTQRVSATMLGPAARKMGTALFHAMP